MKLIFFLHPNNVVFSPSFWTSRFANHFPRCWSSTITNLGQLFSSIKLSPCDDRGLVIKQTANYKLHKIQQYITNSVLFPLSIKIKNQIHSTDKVQNLRNERSLSKIQVCTGFHAQDTWRNVWPKFIKLFFFFSFIKLCNLCSYDRKAYKIQA